MAPRLLEFISARVPGDTELIGLFVGRLAV